MTYRILNIFILGSFLFCVGCATDSGSEEGAGSDEVMEEMTEASSEDTDQTAQKEDEVEEEFDEFEDSEQNKNNQQASADEEETVEEEPSEEETQEEAAPKQVISEKPAATEVASSVRVNEINYLSSQNGGTIEIKTSSPAQYSVRPNANTNQFVIEIQNAYLADKLKRPYIMRDFDGAFGSINSYQNPGGSVARIVIQLKNKGEPVVSQEGNSILVLPPGQSAEPTNTMAAVNSDSSAGGGGGPSNVVLTSDNESYNQAEAKKDEALQARTLNEFLTSSGKFYGRPISIQGNDADIRDLIGFIAEESGANLVIDEGVKGTISLKLRQVPWDQALVIVMKAKGLGYVRQGNVLRITTLDNLQKEAAQASSLVDSQTKLAPLNVKVVPVSYAAVADLEKQIKPFLSSRGQIVSDARTSSLIITDTADVLIKAERLIKELDIAPAQVLIEGKIVEATERFTRFLGVNWGYGGAPVVIGPGAGRNGTDVRLSNSFRMNTISSEVAAANTGAFNLRIGAMDFLGSLDAQLGLAEADSLAKIVSSPRIVAMNKEPAEILQAGEAISVVRTLVQSTTGTSDGVPVAAQINRIPLELKLSVTPQITSEGSVILAVDLKRQFAGPIEDVQSGTRATNTRTAKTKVLVPNGQTAVIGGVYQSDETEAETGIPGLRNIPVLGWLFKSRNVERQKNELLLFLTPRILNAKEQSVEE